MLRHIKNSKTETPFGSVMPGRSFNSTEYRFGFNGMEKDDEVKGEGNSVNYKARIYDPRIGKFLSVDPLTSKYPELTPYQFASNTPIQAIDLDGLEAFFVSGTWYGKQETWSQNTRKDVREVLGNSSDYHLKWSGNNNSLARKIDAYDVAKQVYETWDKGGRKEGISLVGHSHGGNLMIEVVNILIKDYGIVVENLLTVNTPIIKEHKLDKEIKGKVNHFNIYNTSDKIQVMGGRFYTIDDSDDTGGNGLYDRYDSGEEMFTGEIGPAGRTMKGAINIEYKHKSGVGSDPLQHMGNWGENVEQWKESVKKEIQKKNNNE